MLLIIGVALYTAIIGWSNLGAGFEAVDSGKYTIKQVGDGNPFVSGAAMVAL